MYQSRYVPDNAFTGLLLNCNCTSNTNPDLIVLCWNWQYSLIILMFSDLPHDFQYINNVLQENNNKTIYMHISMMRLTKTAKIEIPPAVFTKHIIVWIHLWFSTWTNDIIRIVWFLVFSLLCQLTWCLCQSR